MSMRKSVFGAGCITIVLAFSSGCDNGAEIHSSGAGGWHSRPQRQLQQPQYPLLLPQHLLRQQ